MNTRIAGMVQSQSSGKRSLAALIWLAASGSCASICGCADIIGIESLPGVGGSTGAGTTGTSGSGGSAAGGSGGSGTGGTPVMDIYGWGDNEYGQIGNGTS